MERERKLESPEEILGKEREMGDRSPGFGCEKEIRRRDHRSIW